MSRTIRNFIGFSITISIVLFAWFLQSKLLLNWDVSWDLLATKRLLNGGTYTKDFFDLNPPLIFYEYFPVIFFERVFSLPEASALRLYVFLLSSISIFFCSLFLRHIFSKKDAHAPWLAYGLFVVINILFFILPANDLGEREHLLLIFTMPYFLAVVSRLQNKPFHPLLAMTVGLFAALGFAIKPYFFAPFLLMELYVLFVTRHLLSWRRTEVVTIILFVLCYTISIFVFYPDYVFTVVPVAKHFYYDGFSDPWTLVFSNTGAFFCYFSIVLYFSQKKNTDYYPLKSVLFISMLGFLIVYFSQQTNWYYHIFPAYAMALFMALFILGLFIKHAKKTILIILYGGGILTFAAVYLNSLYLNGIAYKANNNTLIAFLKHYAKQEPVHFISAAPREIFPAVNEANVRYASRFLHLFWMPGVIKHPIKQYYENDQRYLVHLLAEDITTQNPKYIFVDTKEIKSFYAFKHFDYLPKLLEYPDFKAAFKPYHYFTTIEKNVRPMDQKGWNLYFIPDRKEIHPSTLRGDAVILTGSGNFKRVYFVMNKKFLTKNNKIIYLDIKLTPDEFQFLAEQSGLIQKNIQNAARFNQIITKALIFPIYKYEVYRRDNALTERLA